MCYESSGWCESKGSPELAKGEKRACITSKASAKVQRPDGTWDNGVWGPGGHVGVEAGGVRLEQNSLREKQ